jgi:sulfur carrier protein
LRVVVNEEEREVPEGTTVAGLVEQLRLPAERLALELNRAVIPRAEWPGVVLSEGDRVEIVHFVGGG